MPPRRPSSLPPRTSRQQAILRAAELLFAQRGFHAVTLRQIAELAQVPLALVGYYFGHKEGLFCAVFAHRGAEHREIQRALDAARRSLAQGDGLRRVIDALVQPLLRLHQDPDSRAYARLLARELMHPATEAEAALQQHLDPVLQHFLDALQAALPEASHTEIAEAWRFALGAVLVQIGEPRLERLLPLVQADAPGASRLAERIGGGIRATIGAPRTPLAPLPAKPQR